MRQVAKDHKNWIAFHGRLVVDNHQYRCAPQNPRAPAAKLKGEEVLRTRGFE